MFTEEEHELLTHIVEGELELAVDRHDMKRIELLEGILETLDNAPTVE